MNEKIKQYIDKQQSPQKETLQKIRKMIQKLVPQAEEVMSYGVPAFKYDNKRIMYATFKSHLGIYPEPETIKAFEKELSNYETAEGTIKFKLNESIPYELIDRIVRYRFGLDK